MNQDKLDLSTPDLVNQNIEKIAALFPNCVTETAEGKAIDFDQLKQELNYEVVEGAKERYRLEWPGKKEAIVTANLPTTKTLRPVREDSVNFDTTENIYIEGDNLEVLKILQESYLGKIKMIYIDPPYNTGKDFVYKDNFTQDTNSYNEESGQKDEYGNRLVANPETAGRYHSDWLSMMYPRLKLARNLLTDNGVIFISIGEDEISNLKTVCNEIFGETNSVGLCSRMMKSGSNQGKHFSANIDYVLVYAKKIEVLNEFRERLSDELIKKVYNQIETSGKRKGEKYRTMGLYQSSLEERINQRFWIKCPDGTFCIPDGETLPENLVEGEKVIPKAREGVWRWTYDRFALELKNGNIEFKETKDSPLIDQNREKSKWNIYTKIWLKDRQAEGKIPSDLITKFENRHSSKEIQSLEIPFDFAKPIGLIEFLLEISQTDSNDIVLDFFGGSSTTAHSVLKWNAESSKNIKFILVQLPEYTDEKSEALKLGYKKITDIGKERIRRAGNAIIENQKALIKQKGEELEKSEAKNDLIKDEEKIKLLKSEITSLQFSIDNLDKGFRVYKLDSSNMQDVYYKPQDYKQGQLDVFADNIKPDRTSEDLLTQILLDWGLPLTLKTEKLTIQGKEVFKVDTNYLMACFANGVDEAFAKEIATYKPLRIVFKDSGFKDDTAKENVKQLLKQLSPNTEFKVI